MATSEVEFSLLGEVSDESYVHVIDARGDAYGYGGKTQSRRYIESHPLPSAPTA